MRKGNKKMNSIFHKYQTAPTSQEIYLRGCGYALQDNPPDSNSDRVIDSGYEDVAVENEPIRFVSPEPSTDTVDLEEDPVIDLTVPVESEVDSGNRGEDERLESLAKGNGGKKVKVPLRDVVKAIVMNSNNTEEEEDREIEKMSYVQILVQKGFKFP